jgi:hypothetical protein
MTNRERAAARVADLVALSASPNEEEARTAAKQACDLVRAHDLAVDTREVVEVGRAMVGEELVVLPRAEYEALLESAEGPARRRAPSRRARGDVAGIVADASGDVVRSLVGGLVRRL